MSAERKRLRKSSDEGEDAQEDPEVKTDSVLLQEFVPEEVWELVSKKVLEAGSMDHQHLVNSSQFFQNIRACQTARTTYLFEQVFPLVAKSVYKRAGLAGFPVTDVLNCRQVCKKWNAVIDKVLPQFKGCQPYKGDDIGYEFYCIERNEFSWPESGSKGYMTPGAENSVQDFMQYFEPTHDPTNPSKGRSPFVCRNVELDIRPLEDDDDGEEKVVAYHRYLKDFSSMVTKYGKHVRKFHLTIINDHVFENPSLFREWLLQMPNLIKFSFVNRSDMGEINDFPLFPKLKFLEKLTMADLPLQLFNQLLGQNNHISKLDVCNMKDFNFTVHLPNLKQLEIYSPPDDIVEKLASTQVQWSLETLELKRVKLVSCAPLFQVIQDKFADTLEHLSLEIIGQDADGVEGSLWHDCKNFRLDLPKLKKIQLDLGKSPVCLDFLMPMKNNLEEIVSSYRTPYRRLSQEVRSETSGAIIQYSDFESEMRKSNIWSILPKLKKIEVPGVGPDWYTKTLNRPGC